MKLRRVSGNGVVATAPHPARHVLVDRRDFLKAAAIGGLGAGVTAPSLVREVEAQEKVPQPPKLDQYKTICVKCAVGCGFIGEVQGGVWVSQEPWFEHPINLGSLCSKGAAARAVVTSEKRLKYPMKLEGGKWKRISWDQAMSEITAKLLDLRKKHGPDALQINYSAHMSNENGYAIRKFAGFWGSNNCDHQARICHSTTVAGLANVWGYGAMTNNQNDIRNSRSILIIGMNPAETHPISMQHILTAKEVNRAVMIVAEPRFTKTAAFANKFVRIRSGTDVAFIFGLIHIILANGWEDQRMINERTYGFEELKAEVAKYDPDTVSDITGAPKAELQWVARAMAENRPGCVIWAMGGTQHTNGTAIVRSYCALQLVLGNMGVPGGGAQVFRGHDQIQGVTDVGGGPESLPDYRGVGESAWKYWSQVWGVPYDWMVARFKDKKMMEKPGLTVSRWYESVLLDPKQIGQDTPVRAVIYWGHSSNSIQQMDRLKKGLEKVELLVDIDPFVTNTAVLPERADGVYILPAASNYEQPGSATNTNRDLQWRQKIVDPVWESRTDLAIMLDLAERLGFKNEYAKNMKGPWKGVPASMKDVKALPEQTVEDVLREINMSHLAIGYIGQTPERLKRQQQWAHVFEIRTKKAVGGPVDGEQWGLPWPCWTDTHPGTSILYRTDIPASEGGGGFRARWGPKAPDGRSLLAASAPPGGPEEGYPAEKDYATDLTMAAIKKALAEGKNPYGNGRARLNAWDIPDPVPVHREPIHSPRPDLITKWPTYDDVKEHYRIPQPYKSMQKPEWVKDYPIILTSGRQVEFEGGGAAERGSWWLVELNPEMYVEIHPKLAHDVGVRHGEWVWIESPEDMDGRPSRIKVKARVTKRVAPDTVFLPYHWGGVFEGKSLVHKWPEGTAPYAVGESANTVTNYGYDRVTQMQETKTGLCRVKKA